MYIYAVQERGRELCVWKGIPAKKSDVRAVYGSGTVAIVDGREVVATASWDGDLDDVRLYRWDADDKLAKPVARRVLRAQEVS